MDQNDYSKYHITEYMLPDIDSTLRVFAAHIRTVSNKWSYSEHSHPLFELNVVLSGTQMMVVNGHSYVQHAGDMMLLLPEDVHQSRVEGDQDLCYYCLHFNVDDRSLREQLYRLTDCLYPAQHHLTLAIQSSLEQLVMITTEAGSAKMDNKMRALSAVFALFATMSGYVSEQVFHDRTAIRNDIASLIAQRLEQLVEHSQQSEPHTVAEVIADTGYSASSCNRRFQEVYGMSPRQYLSLLKLKKAKLLLMNPQLSIEHISITLGYKDIAHFSRQFKRWTGEPPGQFRAKFHN